MGYIIGINVFKNSIFSLTENLSRSFPYILITKQRCIFRLVNRFICMLEIGVLKFARACLIEFFQLCISLFVDSIKLRGEKFLVNNWAKGRLFFKITWLLDNFTAIIILMLLENGWFFFLSVWFLIMIVLYRIGFNKLMNIIVYIIIIIIIIIIDVIIFVFIFIFILVPLNISLTK